MANRTRRKQKNMRLLDDVIELISLRAAAAGMSESRYVESLILGQAEVLALDDDLLRNIYLELAAQGGNLNQVTKAFNRALKTEESPKIHAAALATSRYVKESQSDRSATLASLQKTLSHSVKRSL